MTSYFVPSASSSAWHAEEICDGFACLHIIIIFIFYFLAIKECHVSPEAVLRGNKPSLSLLAYSPS